MPLNQLQVDPSSPSPSLPTLWWWLGEEEGERGLFTEYPQLVIYDDVFSRS